MSNSGRVVFTIVAALAGVERFGFTRSADRTLSLPEEVCGVHLHRYNSLNNLEYEFDLAAGLVGILIVRDGYGVNYNVSVALSTLQAERGTFKQGCTNGQTGV